MGVRLRFSDLDPGQVTGYAVTLPGHTDRTGIPVWYGSGRLAAGLTLPRLRRRWNQGRSTGPEHPQAFRFTMAEQNAVYQHAARDTAAAAEHIRRCAATDPGCAADSAWAAADTLHAAAKALRNPLLRCAAGAYDRAARAPHGRIPRCTTDGDRLRRAARLMALTGGITLAAAALLASLTALTIAVAELRQAQHQAAQAAAARTAAAHLHSAMTRARVNPPRMVPGLTPRKPAAAGAARHDFPSPLDLHHPPAEDHLASRSARRGLQVLHAPPARWPGPVRPVTGRTP